MLLRRYPFSDVTTVTKKDDDPLSIEVDEEPIFLPKAVVSKDSGLSEAVTTASSCDQNFSSPQN